MIPPAPVEFTPPRGWNTTFLMGSLLFVGLGLWLAFRRESEPRTRGIGVGNALFFGACAWIFVREDRRKGVRLRLDAAGLDLRHPRSDASFQVPWPEVAKVAVRSEERASLVVVTFQSPRRLPPAAAPDWARLEGAWPPLMPIETLLSPGELGTDGVTLAAEIDRFRIAYATAPPTLNWDELM